MSAFNRSEEDSYSNYVTSETTTSSATAYANGTRGSTTTQAVSSLNGNCTVGDLCFNPSVNGAATQSSMAIKREYQDDDSSYTDDSSSGLDWKQNSKAVKLGDRAVDYSMTSPNYSSTDSNAANSSLSQRGTRRSTGSRSGKDDKLSPEEEERRRLRRERNKVAAAKCRQKRVDLTNQLLAETKSLEEEQSRLKETIKTYQQEKEELEFVLEAHRLRCGAVIQPSILLHESSLAAPTKSEEMSADVQSAVAASSMPKRPNMIPIAKISSPTVSSTTGETISSMQTPILSSGVYVLGLQSMINGHTGLTPVTGLPSEIVPVSESFPAGEGKASSFGPSSDSKLTTL